MFAERLRELRTEHNLQQKELAKKLFVDASTVSQWERGKAKPDYQKQQMLADLFNVSLDYLTGRSDTLTPTKKEASPQTGVKIPVLGTVRAGYPIYAEENILDYEEISRHMASTGEFFALRIVGDSMEPRMFSGDIIIVRKQEYIDSGDIAVVLVDGFEATVKKVIKQDKGIMLIPLNSSCDYEPTFYSSKEIETLPVAILGKVVEVRGRV